MAKDKDMPEFRLIPHASKSQQSTEGLASTGAGENQHVKTVGCVVVESASQQLNQLLLPLPRFDFGITAACRQREGRDFDDVTAEDESF